MLPRFDSSPSSEPTELCRRAQCFWDSACRRMEDLSESGPSP